MADAEDLFAYTSDEAVAKYATWNAHETIQDTKDFIQFVLKWVMIGDFGSSGWLGFGEGNTLCHHDIVIFFGCMFPIRTHKKAPKVVLLFQVSTLGGAYQSEHYFS